MANTVTGINQDLLLNQLQISPETSLYGYSDRIEQRADFFALSYLQKRHGNVDAFERLVTRLLVQSQADGGLLFMSFYSNQIRLKARLQSIEEWRETHQIHPIAEQRFDIASFPKGGAVMEALS